jgi:ABC-type spermidine/putrescine transport system permease subunit II
MTDGAPLYRTWPMWLIIGAAIAFLYMPLVPALLLSVRGEGAEEFTFRWFYELWRIPLVITDFGPPCGVIDP